MRSYVLHDEAALYKNYRAFRIIHVSIFLVYGIIASIIYELGNLSGVLFGVFGIILGIQYGMFRKRLRTTLIIIVALYGASVL